MNHSPRRLCHRGAYRSVRASQKQPPLRGRVAASELEAKPLRSVAIKCPPSISKPVIAPPLKSSETGDETRDFVLSQILLRYGKWWLLLIVLIGCLAITQQLL